MNIKKKIIETIDKVLLSDSSQLSEVDKKELLKLRKAAKSAITVGEIVLILKLLWEIISGIDDWFD